jgi:CRP-like cAMP-binding protein
VRIEVALAKQTIQKHGGRSKSLYVITKGIVNILDSTKTVVYTQLSKSSHFGELNLFYEKSNLFTAVALEDCIFMVWTQDMIDEVLEYYPHYRALFYEVCERRIEKMCWILTEKVRSETLEPSAADRCKKEITFQNQ